MIRKRWEWKTCVFHGCCIWRRNPCFTFACKCTSNLREEYWAFKKKTLVFSRWFLNECLLIKIWRRRKRSTLRKREEWFSFKFLGVIQPVWIACSSSFSHLGTYFLFFENPFPPASLFSDQHAEDHFLLALGYCELHLQLYLYIYCKDRNLWILMIVNKRMTHHLQTFCLLWSDMKPTSFCHLFIWKRRQNRLVRFSEEIFKHVCPE